MVPQNNSIKCFLPEHYVPSEFDGLCGRGVECFRHSGNAIFRQTVDQSVNQYATALSKQKSIVMKDVITQIRSKSSEPPIKFIRLCRLKQCWYEITDYTIRRKVAQTLREALVQRDPEKRKLYNKKRAKKRALRLAKQFQLTASQETLSLFGVADFPCFQYIPFPSSFWMMQTPTPLSQTSVLDLVYETLGCIDHASLVDPFDETLRYIQPAFPPSKSLEDWFTASMS
jgi:hypothetical protein